MRTKREQTNTRKKSSVRTEPKEKPKAQRVTRTKEGTIEELPEEQAP